MNIETNERSLLTNPLAFRNGQASNDHAPRSFSCFFLASLDIDSRQPPTMIGLLKRVAPQAIIITIKSRHDHDIIHVSSSRDPQMSPRPAIESS